MDISKSEAIEELDQVNEELDPTDPSDPSEPSEPSETAKKSVDTVEPVQNINHVLAFKSIHSFVTAMSEEFGNKSKSLKLYARLIEQTTFSHEFAIKKHVKCFTEWCIKNREEIYSKDHLNLKGKISYSDKVHLSMRDLFKIADTEQRKIMWQHILTISALVDSTGKAKQILKQSMNSSNETNFLTNIIEKVEQNVNVNSSNPMEAIGSIMSSGI